MTPACEARLDAGLAELGLEVDATARERLLALLALLHKWNRAYNLTAVRDPEQMVTRHLLDSASVATAVRGPRLLDVGAGAGLPGLVLAILDPSLEVTMLDGNGKKVRFQRQAVLELGLENVTPVQVRVEHFATRDFDQIVSRAFAQLATFVELTRPLLAEGGDGTPASDLGFPITVPGARNAAPDYLETIYRGTTVDENIATRGENYYIPGFVRQKVGQFSMTGIRILGNSHPLSALVGTEQIINLVEVGFTHIVDMVPADQVQFDGGSPNRTHYSPGADGTGQPDGEPDPRSLNPTQQREAFVDSFAWGYRLISFLEYNDVFWNLNFKPFVSFSHDVEGYAPYPMQNFIEDRMEWMLGSEVFYGQRWSAKLQYQGMTGNRHNSRRDRDNVLVELSYTF